MNAVDDYLAPYPPEIRAAAGELRALIKTAVPGVIEALYPGWQLIGYRVPHGARSRYFCYIAPYNDHLRLGFEWGILMADEQGLLEGDGSQVRQVTIGAAGEIQPELLTTAVREAAAVALLDKAAKEALALQREAERERPS